MSKSPKQLFLSLPRDKQTAYVESLSEQQAQALINSWWWTARPEQLAPEGEWDIWLILAGRGWGKTRASAEYVIDQIMNEGYREVALVGRTARDVRQTMVPAILEAARVRGLEAYHEPSKTQITFGNGALARTFSAEAGDQLRGPQHDLAWCDELAAWPRDKGDADAWMNLKATLRVKGRRPRIVASTTPRPTPLMQELVTLSKEENPTVVVTRGSTFDNADNLDAAYVASMKKSYEGTRIGRQELYGEILDDIDGALWKYDDIANARVDSAPNLKRIVVAVDPATTDSAGSDYTGISVVGLSFSDELYVLHSEQVKLSPNGWANRVLNLFDEYEADKIIAERNQGGQMVEHTIRTVRDKAPLKTIHASRGKQTRAEPVAALYEQGRVHHVGNHSDLESQMIVFPVASEHDDMVDSLVYGITELSGLGAKQTGTFITYSRGKGRIR